MPANDPKQYEGKYVAEENTYLGLAIPMTSHL